MGSISAAEANRNFSALLRRVQGGERVTITNRGRPVAEIGPPARSPEEFEAAKRALFKHLRAQPPRVIGPWTRGELYDRDDEPPPVTTGDGPR